MKSSSDHFPEVTIQSNGKTQIRFNITQVTRAMMDKETTSYDYDYVEIEGEVTRAKIISTIIRSQYTADAELALINNELAVPGTAEYTEYQEYRVFAKGVASEIME